MSTDCGQSTGCSEMARKLFVETFQHFALSVSGREYKGNPNPLQKGI